MTNFNTKPVDRAWLARMADAEERCPSISAGGLAADFGMPRHIGHASFGPQEASTQVALAKLVELWRRQHRLTVEEFAKRANLTEAEIVGIETAEFVPEPRILWQLSKAIRISYDKLMLIAGHVVNRDESLSNAAVRFAARSETMEQLTRQEQEALHEFINLLAQ